MFIWEKIDVPGLEPLAFHSVVVMGDHLYVFGGLNIKTKQRHSISPKRISLLDWTLTQIQVEGLPSGCLAGAGLAAGDDHAYLVGGYQQQFAKEKDKPSHNIIQFSFYKG